MRLKTVFFLFLIISVLIGFLRFPGVYGDGVLYPPSRTLWNGISSWLYVLQDGDIADILRYRPDIVVMDYSRDGGEDTKYSPEEISLLKEQGIIPIAYISIGEAEDYRWYWKEEYYKNPPPWLGKENPNWPGNWAVKFWYREWQDIIYRYIDKVIDQGFMGVYLDKVDIYEYWADDENGEDVVLPLHKSASLMMGFVSSISHYGKKKSSPFYVFVQNGEDIIAYDGNSVYMSSIDGIGVESVFYEDMKPLPYDYTRRRIQFLKEFKRDGKVVLDVEYVYDGDISMLIKAYTKALYHGFIPYVAYEDTDLDEIVYVPPYQPFIGCGASPFRYYLK